VEFDALDEYTSRREEIARRRAIRRREERERRATLRRRRALQVGGLGAVAALILIVAAGGGGSSSRLAKVELRTASYTWTPDVNEKPATVAQENRRPGTYAWQLPGGRARGVVDGYVASQSIRPGDFQKVYVRAAGARWIRIQIYRMGWYGGREGRLVLTSRRLPAPRQPKCQHDARTGLTECRWHPSLRFRMPGGLTSGVYIVKMATNRGGERYCMFVLESARTTPLLAQLPTATYEAYNDWGGDSLYPGGRGRVGITGTHQGVEVSYDRPYATVTGAGRFFAGDVAMVRFLEREGYDVSYTTDPSVEVDPGQLRGHRVLLDVGHSEYWSQGAANAFARARDSGTNLAFLASNTMAWLVRYGQATRASSEAGSPGHRIIAYKEHAALDPDRRVPTGLFPRGGAPITGTAWGRCVTPRYRLAEQLAGQPTYHYYAWRPGPSLGPPWLFRGTGFTSLSEVRGIVGYEVDRSTLDSPPGIQVVGSGTTPCLGGRPLTGLSQSTLYTTASHALVFSSGTMGWQQGLSPVPDASPDAPRVVDPRLVRLTENLLDRMLGAAPRPR
jgi:hypothetical protein